MIIKKMYFKEIINNLEISQKEINNLIKNTLTKNQYKIYCMRFDEKGNIISDIRTIANKLNITHQAVNEALIRIYTRITKKLIKEGLISINYIDNISKKDQLIETINELHRLPHSEINKKDNIPERIFTDRTNQRGYYNRIRKLALEYKEKSKNTILTKEEQQIINDYDEIQKVLEQYKPKIELTDHSKELIKTINELHRLPKANIGATPERVFKNGTNQRSYYDTLCNKYIKVKDKSENELSYYDKMTIYNYTEIRKVLKQYKKAIRRTISKKDKKEQLIEYIEKYHSLPPTAPEENDKEAFYEDGTLKRIFYFYLQQKSNDLLKLNRPLNKEEKQIIDDYNEVKKVYRKYFPKNSLDYKLNRLIEIINKTHKLPESKKDSKDGINYKIFYDILTRAIRRNKRKLENNIPLKEIDRRYEEMIERINNVKSFHPKKQNNIKLIKKLCTELNIDVNKNKELLNKSYSEVYSKIRFLLDNNIPLQINNKLNDIFFMTDINMQKKYNISIDELINKYIYGEYNVTKSIEIIKEYKKEK